MKNEKQTQILVEFIEISCIIMLISTYVLTILGVIDIKYVNNMEFTPIIEFLGQFSLVMIQIFLMFKIYLKDKHIKATMAYIPIALMCELVPVENYYIATIIVPVIFSTAILLYKKYPVKNLAIAWIATAIVQAIFGTVKVYNFNFNFVETNFVTAFILSIDIIVFLIFLERRINHYGKSFKILESHLYAKRRSVRQNEKCSNENILNPRQKAAFITMVMGYQLFQLLVVLTIGTINNKFVEILIILPVFWVGKIILKKSWHSAKLWICNMATFTGFYILTEITPEVEVSIFMVILCTGAFVKILNIIAETEEHLEFLEKKYQTDFTKYGLSAEMAEFANDWIAEKMHDKDLMKKYNISSTNTLNSRKRRIKAKMNTN